MTTYPWPTWEDRERWPNFGPHELACGCGCGYGTRPGDVSETLLDGLETMRQDLGEPMYVESGARCVDYNEAIGGVDGSAHSPLPDRPACTAADVRLGYVYGPYRFRLIRAAYNAGFHGIGVASGFVHVDCDHVKPRPAAWTY
jgi:uncharacterized protein YcbK (DUF882 family)